MSTSASRPTSYVDQVLTLKFRFTLAELVFLVAPGIMLIVIIVALLRVTLNHLAPVLRKRTRQWLCLTFNFLIVGVSLIIGRILGLQRHVQSVVETFTLVH